MRSWCYLPLLWAGGSKSANKSVPTLDTDWIRISLHYVNATTLSRYHRISRDITSRAVPNVSQINNQRMSGNSLFLKTLAGRFQRLFRNLVQTEITVLSKGIIKRRRRRHQTRTVCETHLIFYRSDWYCHKHPEGLSNEKDSVARRRSLIGTEWNLCFLDVVWIFFAPTNSKTTHKLTPSFFSNSDNDDCFEYLLFVTVDFKISPGI